MAAPGRSPSHYGGNFTTMRNLREIRTLKSLKSSNKFAQKVPIEVEAGLRPSQSYFLMLCPCVSPDTDASGKADQSVAVPGTANKKRKKRPWQPIARKICKTPSLIMYVKQKSPSRFFSSMA